MDYKKYSLEHLETWLYDAMSCGNATPQEIYDLIIKVVKDEYYTYKKQASEAYELLALLNGNNIPDSIKDQVKETGEVWDKEDKILSCDKDDTSPECKGAWNDFWASNNTTEYNLREAEYYNKRVQLDVNYNDMISSGYTMTDDGIWIKEEIKDKVVKWQLPVQVDGLTGDCFIEFPDDLLEAANLKEGDTVNWIDRGDGSFELRKVTKNLEMDEC
jgi:hypothetical protein